MTCLDGPPSSSRRRRLCRHRAGCLILLLCCVRGLIVSADAVSAVGGNPTVRIESMVLQSALSDVAYRVSMGAMEALRATYATMHDEFGPLLGSLGATAPTTSPNASWGVRGTPAPPLVNMTFQRVADAFSASVDAATQSARLAALLADGAVFGMASYQYVSVGFSCGIGAPHFQAYVQNGCRSLALCCPSVGQQICSDVVNVCNQWALCDGRMSWPNAPAGCTVAGDRCCADVHSRMVAQYDFCATVDVADGMIRRVGLFDAGGSGSVETTVIPKNVTIAVNTSLVAPQPTARLCDVATFSRFAVPQCLSQALSGSQYFISSGRFAQLYTAPVLNATTQGFFVAFTDFIGAAPVVRHVMIARVPGDSIMAAVHSAITTFVGGGSGRLAYGAAFVATIDMNTGELLIPVLELTGGERGAADAWQALLDAASRLSRGAASLSSYLIVPSGASRVNASSMGLGVYAPLRPVLDEVRRISGRSMQCALRWNGSAPFDVSPSVAALACAVTSTRTLSPSATLRSEAVTPSLSRSLRPTASRTPPPTRTVMPTRSRSATRSVLPPPTATPAASSSVSATLTPTGALDVAPFFWDLVLSSVVPNPQTIKDMAGGSSVAIALLTGSQASNKPATLQRMIAVAECGVQAFRAQDDRNEPPAWSDFPMVMPMVVASPSSPFAAANNGALMSTLMLLAIATTVTGACTYYVASSQPMVPKSRRRVVMYAATLCFPISLGYYGPNALALVSGIIIRGKGFPQPGDTAFAAAVGAVLVVALGASVFAIRRSIQRDASHLLIKPHPFRASVEKQLKSDATETEESTFKSANANSNVDSSNITPKHEGGGESVVKNRSENSGDETIDNRNRVLSVLDVLFVAGGMDDGGTTPGRFGASVDVLVAFLLAVVVSLRPTIAGVMCNVTAGLQLLVSLAYFLYLLFCEPFLLPDRRWMIVSVSLQVVVSLLVVLVVATAQTHPEWVVDAFRLFSIVAILQSSLLILQTAVNVGTLVVRKVREGHVDPKGSPDAHGEASKASNKIQVVNSVHLSSDPRGSSVLRMPLLASDPPAASGSKGSDSSRPPSADKARSETTSVRATAHVRNPLQW